jgi:hypothetical protein
MRHVAHAYELKLRCYPIYYSTEERNMKSFRSIIGTAGVYWRQRTAYTVLPVDRHCYAKTAAIS